MMLVKQLIEQLQKVNPEARVFAGYDGNIVVESLAQVEEIEHETQIGPCWCSVEVGDVVILSGR